MEMQWDVDIYIDYDTLKEDLVRCDSNQECAVPEVRLSETSESRVPWFTMSKLRRGR